jgi:hypothetical protein
MERIITIAIGAVTLNITGKIIANCCPKTVLCIYNTGNPESIGLALNNIGVFP